MKSVNNSGKLVNNLIALTMWFFKGVIKNFFDHPELLFTSYEKCLRHILNRSQSSDLWYPKVKKWGLQILCDSNKSCWSKNDVSVDHLIINTSEVQGDTIKKYFYRLPVILNFSKPGMPSREPETSSMEFFEVWKIFEYFV